MTFYTKTYEPDWQAYIVDINVKPPYWYWELENLTKNGKWEPIQEGTSHSEEGAKKAAHHAYIHHNPSAKPSHNERFKVTAVSHHGHRSR